MCPKIRRRDSWILSRSVAERSSLRGKSFISWLYLCTAHNPSASNRRKRIVRGGKRTVICSILQPNISNKTNNSMKPLSKLNQKLISCDAVPLATSLFNFVTACMDLIHELTCAWKVFRNIGSFRSFWGMWERVGVSGGGGEGFGDCALDCGVD
jgi:hypothetical protein